MLWIAAAILSLTALTLLTLALRGKRVGSTPHCRRCNFDLRGLADTTPKPDAPDPPTRCPECGRSLDSPRAIARGERRRRPAALALASLLLTAALALGALGLSASNTNLNAAKPNWLLMIEATRLGEAPHDAAAAELLTRHAKSPLPTDRLAALVAPALDAQADPLIDWRTSTWWELLDAAFASGAVTGAQRERYAEQALSTLRVQLPPFMLAAEPWPRRITSFNPSLRGTPHIVPSQPVAHIITLDRATLDGRPLALTRSGHDTRDGWAWTATPQAHAMRSTAFGLSQYTQTTSSEVPFENHTLTMPGVDPGDHTLIVEYTVRAFADPGLTIASGARLTLDADSPTTRWPLRVEHTFTAKATPEEISRLTAPGEAPDFDPHPEANPKNSLNVSEIIPGDPSRVHLTYSITRADIREGTPWIVGRIELRSGDQVWPAIDAWPRDNSAKPVILTLAAPPGAPQGMGLDFVAAGLPRLDKVDIAIVPDLHGAAVRGIAGPIWADEILIPDVPINWFQVLPSENGPDQP